MPKALVAVSAMVATCGALGVPLMTPVVASSVRPEGSGVAENEVGLFVAVMV